jgi:hypothetical protein
MRDTHSFFCASVRLPLSSADLRRSSSPSYAAHGPRQLSTCRGNGEGMREKVGKLASRCALVAAKSDSQRHHCPLCSRSPPLRTSSVTSPFSWRDRFTSCTASPAGMDGACRRRLAAATAVPLPASDDASPGAAEADATRPPRPVGSAATPCVLNARNWPSNVTPSIASDTTLPTIVCEPSLTNRRAACGCTGPTAGAQSWSAGRLVVSTPVVNAVCSAADDASMGAPAPPCTVSAPPLEPLLYETSAEEELPMGPAAAAAAAARATPLVGGAATTGATPSRRGCGLYAGTAAASPPPPASASSVYSLASRSIAAGCARAGWARAPAGQRYREQRLDDCAVLGGSRASTSSRGWRIRSNPRNWTERGTPGARSVCRSRTGARPRAVRAHRDTARRWPLEVRGRRHKTQTASLLCDAIARTSFHRPARFCGLSLFGRCVRFLQQHAASKAVGPCARGGRTTLDVSCDPRVSR